MKAPGPWVVAKCDFGTSKIDGSDMTTITFINAQAKITHSYVDHANNNYQHWQAIITGYDNGHGIVVDNLRYKVRNKVIQQRHIFGYDLKEDLINADSIPELLVVDDMQTVIDRLAEVLE